MNPDSDSSTPATCGTSTGVDLKRLVILKDEMTLESRCPIAVYYEITIWYMKLEPF